MAASAAGAILSGMQACWEAAGSTYVEVTAGGGVALGYESIPAEFGRKGPAQGGGIRGQVRGYSAASRKRLLLKLSEADRAYAAVFLTFTLPGSWDEDVASHDPAVWRGWGGAIRNAVWESVKGWGCVAWRLEFQRRLAPHWHLMVLVPKEDVRRAQALFGVLPAGDEATARENAERRSYWARRWWKIVGSGEASHLAAGVRIERPESPRAVVAYMGKELSKASQATGARYYEANFAAPCGRFWGVLGERVFRRLGGGSRVRVALDPEGWKNLMGWLSETVGERLGRTLDSVTWSVAVPEVWEMIVDWLDIEGFGSDCSRV